MERTGRGTSAAQTGIRPDPTAMAGAATSAQSSSDQTTTRGVLGSVSGVAATAATSTAVTTYPAVNSPEATGTVQSRPPSSRARTSGPWPETESPTRSPTRHRAQATSAVTPSGTAVTATPSIRTPEP